MLSCGHNYPLLLISAVPGVPQGVLAIKISPPSDLEENCVIIVNWNPPNTSLVKEYMVESPSGNLTTTMTVDSVVYDCEMESSDQVRIHAVDFCDRSGASSVNTIAGMLAVAARNVGSNRKWDNLTKSCYWRTRTRFNNIAHLVISSTLFTVIGPEV